MEKIFLNCFLENQTKRKKYYNLENKKHKIFLVKEYD